MFWVKGGQGKQKNPHFPDIRSFQVTFETQPKVQPLCTAPTAPAVLIYTDISPKIPQGKCCQYFGSARKLSIASQYQKKNLPYYNKCNKMLSSCLPRAPSLPVSFPAGMQRGLLRASAGAYQYHTIAFNGATEISSSCDFTAVFYRA